VLVAAGAPVNAAAEPARGATGQASPIHSDCTSEGLQQVGLKEHEGLFGPRGQGHRLYEAVHHTSPQLRQTQALVHQVVEHGRKRGPGSEPHTHDGGVRRNDLDLRTGQLAPSPAGTRTIRRPAFGPTPSPADQLGPATDREVDLDPTRG
jgi:hypothetical protein